MKSTLKKCNWTVRVIWAVKEQLHLIGILFLTIQRAKKKKETRERCCLRSMADLAEGPGDSGLNLFLGQTEARRAEKNYFGGRPPLILEAFKRASLSWRFYIADSFKVALVIGNCALGSYCLVVTQVNHCIVRNAQMLSAQLPTTAYQSNLFWFSCITKRAVFHGSSIDMWRPFNDSPSTFPGLTQILLMALQSTGPLQILIQTEHLSVACMPGKATLRTVELVSETLLSILREPLWQR